MRIQYRALQMVVVVQARQFGREQCYRGGVARLETGYTNIRIAHMFHRASYACTRSVVSVIDNPRRLACS